MRTAKALVIAASIVGLAGCVGPQVRLAEQDRRALSDAPQIHVVHYVMRGAFLSESTGRRVAGVIFSPLVAVVAGIGDGDALHRNLGLEDPVLRVRDRLAGALSKDFKLANVRLVEEPAQSDQIDELRARFQTGLILDVRTTGWGVDNDRAKYAARARLLRLADSTLLWQGNCEHVADKELPSPERVALVADNGALLKAKLLRAAERCADQLVQTLGK
jgi:hypothetical protein